VTPRLLYIKTRLIEYIYSEASTLANGDVVSEALHMASEKKLELMAWLFRVFPKIPTRSSGIYFAQFIPVEGMIIWCCLCSVSINGTGGTFKHGSGNQHQIKVDWITKQVFQLPIIRLPPLVRCQFLRNIALPEGKYLMLSAPMVWRSVREKQLKLDDESLREEVFCLIIAVMCTKSGRKIICVHFHDSIVAKPQEVFMVLVCVV